jgi:hypothetical protein
MRKVEIYIEAALHSPDSSLLNLWGRVGSQERGPFYM